MSLDTFPEAIRDDVRRARRLEYWNIGWTISIIVVMGLAMGGSQTMKTAWVEDTLGLIPPIAFLVALKIEAKPHSKLFPFGFDRAQGLAFLIAAVALALVGAMLLWDAAGTLIAREHAMVGSIRILGRDIWLGWIMIAAQLYSIVPPFIIGRMELPLAERMQDEVLYTDAKMNKANWMTGVAGLGGVIGLGMGWWWADSVAAAIISIDIIRDGWRALKIASAELIDGLPRKLGATEPDPDAVALMERLERFYPDAKARVRDTGRYMRAEVIGASPGEPPDLIALWPGDPDRGWRLAEVSFLPDKGIGPIMSARADARVQTRLGQGRDGADLGARLGARRERC
ncbi:cobalt transporter [Sphingomonas gilva]|uniref:Cobalt transporter n=1 Tax=Sphingomonas gilva TaxID=2305907 RepID=A0A396S5Q2_9SPHN|nr:cation transporter [Sphingomonas gilva]RHW18735.1 cobalt transporter [Sphingomonas gilva]